MLHPKQTMIFRMVLAYLFFCLMGYNALHADDTNRLLQQAREHPSESLLKTKTDSWRHDVARDAFFDMQKPCAVRLDSIEADPDDETVYHVAFQSSFACLNARLKHPGQSFLMDSLRVSVSGETDDKPATRLHVVLTGSFSGIGAEDSAN
jgi:hypothetical protein